MIELIVMAGGAAALFGLLHFAQKRQEATESFDINEGIAPAVDGPIDIDALRQNPARLEELRGKVSSVVYYEGYGLNNEEAIGESWLIDSNGATVQLDKRYVHERGRLEVASIKPRTEPVGRNVEIEQDARWLADQLGVPFED